VTSQRATTRRTPRPYCPFRTVVPHGRSPWDLLTGGWPTRPIATT